MGHLMQTNFNPSETEVVCLESYISGKKEGLSGWNTNRYLRGNTLSVSKNSLSLLGPLFKLCTSNLCLGSLERTEI